MVYIALRTNAHAIFSIAVLIAEISDFTVFVRTTGEIKLVALAIHTLKATAALVGTFALRFVTGCGFVNGLVV